MYVKMIKKNILNIEELGNHCGVRYMQRRYIILYYILN